MSAGEEARHPLDILAEEFVTRLRRGDAPDVDAYADAHPDLADRIRELFPTLLVMEELASDGQDGPDGSPGPDGMPPPLPDVVGGYRLVRELGSGGMGAVYEARRESGSPDEAPPVALKVLHRHLAHRPGFAERFLREASLGRRIDHPNVVRALDAGVQEEAGGREMTFLVMEYVAGSSLRELADSLGGRVPEALLRHLALQVARGLTCIHEEGIVHRDLKPSNVMVTRERQVRIMDLGVARLLDAADRVSSTGQFVGSVRYAAPEQFREGADPVGPAADLYSFGVTFYELATGRHPFQATTPYALMTAHLHQHAPAARTLDAELSPFLSDLLETLLAKDPSDRVADAATLCGILSEGEASTWWATRRSEMSSPASRVTRPAVRHDVPLFGREKERARLKAAYDEAAEGHGRVVVLRGEAGVGKTRLLDAFASDLEGASARVLYGSYPPGGEQSALADALVGAFGRAGLARELRRRLSETPELCAAFTNLLRGLPSAPEAPPLDARTLRALHARLLEALAEERPLVWIVDDLHFAPETDLHVILAMARALRLRGALLVLTTRDALPAHLEEELARAPHALDVRLERLSRTDTLAVLSKALESAPWAEPLAERMATAADGNPFFLLEMVREVVREREEGALAGTSTPSSEGLRKLPIPAAVRDLVAVRLRGVREEERPLLECGALLGFEFSAGLVAEGLGRDTLDVLQTLGALERRTGIVRSAEDRYRFDHHQILEVLRDEIAPPLARAYHGRIARTLAARGGVTLDTPPTIDGGEAARLAWHALRGGEIALGRLVLPDALDFHQARFQSHQIMELADLALQADPPPDATLSARILLRRAGATDILGLAEEHERDVDAFARAAEQSGREELIARAYHLRGALEVHRGEAAKAREWLEKSLALSRKNGDRPAEHKTLLILALRAGEVSDYALAFEHASAARELARADGDPHREGQAVFSMATSTFFRGDYREAIRHLGTSLDLLDAAGPKAWRNRARAYGMQGNAHFALGAYVEAMVAYQASLEMARRTGDREVQAVNHENLGGTLMALGRVGEALTSLRAGVRMGEQVVTKAKLIGSTANLGSACLWAGRLDEAEGLLREALAEARRVGHTRMVGYTLHDLALWADARGDPEQALNLARASLDVRRPLGREGLAASLLLMGSLVLRHGLDGDAEALLREAGDVAAQTGEVGARVRAALWLQALGADESADTVTPQGLALFDEIEVRLVRHRTDGTSGDLTRAHEFLAQATATLETDAERATFRESCPAWVHYRELA